MLPLGGLLEAAGALEGQFGGGISRHGSGEHKPADRAAPLYLRQNPSLRSGFSNYLRQNAVQSFFQTGCTPAQFSKSIRSEKKDDAFSFPYGATNAFSLTT